MKNLDFKNLYKMRKTMFLLAMLVSFGASAQDTVRFTSASLSSGNGVLSNGLLAELNFSLNDDVFNLTLGERDLYAYYLKSVFKKKILIGPCLEYFYNVPTVSVINIWSPLKHWSTFSWLGYSAGEPSMKVELTKWRFLFFYQSLDFNYKRFGASGAMMYFGGWIPVVDFKYKQPIMPHVNLFTSAGYNFSGEGTALLRLGITYTK